MQKFRGNRLRFAFIMVMIVSNFTVWSPAYGGSGFCETLLGSVAYQFIKWQRGQDIANFYHQIVLRPHFHPDTKIRKKAFQLLAGIEISPEVASFLSYLTPERLAYYIEALSELTRPEQVYILTRVHPFWHWHTTIEDRSRMPGATNPVPRSRDGYVKIENFWISKEKYQEAVDLKTSLAADGINTTLTAGQHHTGGFHPYLVIESINRPLLPGMDPNRSIFDSEEFLYFLQVAKEKQGGFVIDPTLLVPGKTAEAYFWKQAYAVKNHQWFIAVGPKANWSILIHEWIHQQDFVSEKENYHLSLLATQRASRATNWFSKALRSAGERLEIEHLSELNAIKMQFLFYKMTGITPPRFQSDFSYLGKNQWRLALGRILMDPFNLDHYQLIRESVASRLIAWGLIKASASEMFEQ